MPVRDFQRPWALAVTFDEPVVVIPQRLAVLLARPLRVTVARERGDNGATIPAEVLALVEEWERLASRARDRAAATGCEPATPVARQGCAPPPSDLMTTAEAADLIGCTPQNVRQRAGKSLVGRKFGEAGWIFTLAAVEDYINRQETT